MAADVARIEETFGGEHRVESAEHLWVRIDPVAELADRVGADRVIGVVLPD